MTVPRLLAFNDLEGAFDHPERVGRLARRIEARRDASTVVCGAGDDTALGTLALLHEDGRAVARPFFEAVEPDADTFGNHDFDPGADAALSWADSVPTTYCCANLDGPGAGSVPDSTVVDAGGARVGIVGVAHPETASIAGALSGFSFGDPIAAARRAAARLDRDAPDALVVLSHGSEWDRKLAAATDADAVVGGHRHEARCEVVDGTALVRTPGGGTALAEVRLGAEPEPRLHEVAGGPGEASGGGPRPDSDASAVDAELASTYRGFREALGVDEPVARVAEPIPRGHAQRYEGESRAGAFAAEAFRAAADADLGLLPSGALRDGPPLSDRVAVGDVVSLCPFGDTVREVRLSGRELRRALDGCGEPRPDDRGWSRVQVSGCSVAWDSEGRLVGLTVGGEPVADDRQYAVATVGYAVEVAERFDPLAPASQVAEHDRIHEALLAHARDGGLAAARVDGRLRRAE